MDGSISREEFVEGLNELIDEENEKFDEQELDNIFDIIDSDKSNSIEYEEFIRAAADKKALLDKKYLQDAFNFFDKDKSGFIEKDELRELLITVSKQLNLPILTEKEIEEGLKQLDNNNDAREPQKTLFITTEMDKTEIQTIMLAYLSGVNERHILMGQYEEGEEEYYG